MKVNDIMKPKGACTIVLREGYTKSGKKAYFRGRIKSKDRIDNTFVTVGKNSIASALSGVETNNQGIITYCAVGTSVVAATLADTTLTTEIFRKLISVRSSSGKVATFQTFFTTAEANGTLRECGLFGDSASATANSGTLFSKLAINRVKSASDTLTLSWDITIG
jgi:hypothetical protein